MAGLSNDGAEFKTFVTIFEGKFVKKVEIGTPNAVIRTNKNGKEVCELHYKSLVDVYVRDIEKKDHEEYGASWVITLETDDGQSFGLQIPYSGRATNGFMHRLPNIEIDKPITLVPSRFQEVLNGITKYKTHLVVHQFGEKLEKYWTEQNPGDLPQMKKVIFKGVEQWDDTEQMQYIEAMINQQYKPLFAAMKANAPAKPAAPAPAAQPAPVNTAPPVNPTAPVQTGTLPLMTPELSAEIDAYHVATTEYGFQGSLEQFRAYRAAKAAGTTPPPAAPAVKTATPPPVPKTATPPPAKPPAAIPPAPKVSAPQSEANFAGMKGSNVPEDMNIFHFRNLQARGFKGTSADLAAFCTHNNCPADDVFINANGELEKSDLPF